MSPIFDEEPDGGDARVVSSGAPASADGTETSHSGGNLFDLLGK